jgi:lipoate-protein ligase A
MAPRTTLRFYRWASPTVSLGRNQQAAGAVDQEYCGREGIELVHRPTGGRAVLHDDELTYAIASNDPGQFGGGSVYGTYRRISEALLAGYRSLGVDAHLAPETRRSLRNEGPDSPCFVSPSRYELVYRGRKIVGSAQRRLRRSFLQHGSLPLTIDRERLARATRVADRQSLTGQMAGIAECVPRPTIETLLGAFCDAFAESFDVEFSVLTGRLRPVGGSRQRA